MGNQDASRVQVQVGRSAAAREMNCTDEEAAILTRNVKPYQAPNRWLSGAVGGVLRALLFNKGAALFLGTIGYWAFGFLTLGFFFEGVAVTGFLRTGFFPLDMVTENPMVLWAISFFLLVFGMNEGDGRYEPGGVLESLWMGLGAIVLMISLPIAFVWGVLMIPIFFISLLALNSTEPYEIGFLVLCALPAGYLAALKMREIQ